MKPHRIEARCIAQHGGKAKADGKLKNVRIWVRRGGPREKEGLDAMRALKDEGFDINVFDRNTPLTDIVDKALHKQ